MTLGIGPHSSFLGTACKKYNDTRYRWRFLVKWSCSVMQQRTLLFNPAQCVHYVESISLQCSQTTRQWDSKLAWLIQPSAFHALYRAISPITQLKVLSVSVTNVVTTVNASQLMGLWVTDRLALFGYRRPDTDSPLQYAFAWLPFRSDDTSCVTVSPTDLKTTRWSISCRQESTVVLLKPRLHDTTGCQTGCIV